MKKENLSNLRYFRQDKSSDKIYEFLKDSEKVYNVSTGKRTVELPKEATLKDKVVDAPYIKVKLKPEFMEEIKNTIKDNLKDTVALEQISDTEFEVHFTYNLEGGISYAPLLEKDINY